MMRLRFLIYLFLTLAVLMPIFLSIAFAAQSNGLHTIEFETSEVTQADLTVSPDGQTLVFSMLGHIFKLPVDGGTAEQLTFGPCYDSNPVFSPDGYRIAFVSDRDGSESNIFILDPKSHQITQISHDDWAVRPIWCPDSQSIVYLEFVTGTEKTNRGPVAAHIHQVNLLTGEQRAISPNPRYFRSLFYLPDGRFGWTVLEGRFKFRKNNRGPSDVKTQIEVLNPDGEVSVLRTLSGVIDRAVPTPEGNGVYCHHYIPVQFFSITERDALLFLPLANENERHIVSLSNTWYECPHFCVSPNNEFIFISNNGQLLKTDRYGRARKRIPFEAKIKLEVNQPVSMKNYVPPQPGTELELRSVLNPRLSSDGRLLVFGAAGHIWLQNLGSGEIRQITEGGEFSEEAAFSPDGKRVAYIQGERYKPNHPIEYKKEQIKVYDISSGKTRTLTSMDNAQGPPSWSPDGQYLMVTDWANDCLLAINLNDGKQESICEYRYREPRPHYSADGKSIYFTDRSSREREITLFKFSLEKDAKPEPMTELAGHLNNGLISPDGNRAAFRNRTDIWVASLNTKPIKEQDIRLLSTEGGDSFAFAPDGKAVIYASGNRVWIHQIDSGIKQEIPIHLKLKRPIQPPMLLKKVRVLDFNRGAFTGETSLLIEQGRIKWIGSESELPPSTVIVDVGGRFAIPGLFDMHIHGGSQAIYIAYGITSVRNAGAWLPWQNSLADRSDATGDALPRNFYAGNTIRGTKNPNYRTGEFLITSQEEARAVVRRRKEDGAHYIKAYYSLPWKLHRALAEEARLQEMPVVGHGLGVEEITKSVIMGYATLEHSHYCYEDVYLMLKQAGTWWTPTLVAGGGNEHLFRVEPERLSDEKLRSFVSESRIRRGWNNDPFRFISDNASFARWTRILECIRRAHHVGVKMLAGTDSPIGEVFPGISLHWELEGLVKAGLTPLEVLGIATFQAADAVGAKQYMGSIESGKLADIVILDKNPLEDIKNTQSIWRVIKGGRVFDPESLKPEKGANTEK